MFAQAGALPAPGTDLHHLAATIPVCMSVHVNPIQAASGQPDRVVRTGARVLCIGALVGVAVMLAVAAWQDQGDADALAARTGAISRSANRVLVDLLNAETGQRGFLLSGQPVFLQPYRLGSSAVTGDLATLTRVSRTVGRLAADVAALHALTRDKLAFIALTIALARAGHHRQALALVDTDVGQHDMDLARARVADIERVASQLPVVARQAADDAQRLALVVDSVLVALALALAGWWRKGSLRAGRERDRALGELAGEARLERALREVALAADGDHAEADVAAVVADRLGELLDARTAAVIRAEPESLHVIGYRGPTPYPERLGWDERSSSVDAVRTGEQARLEQYGPAGGAVSGFIAAHGLRCGISVPVRTQSRVWGCITVTTTRAGGFSTQEERWLERFASLTSAALANAQAQESLRLRARLEEALREVAVASASGHSDEAELAGLVAARVADLLDSKSTSVVRFDPGRLTLLGSGGTLGLAVDTPIHERSVTGQVAQSGTTVVTDTESGYRYDDLARDAGAHSVVAVPVFVGGALWGSLGAMLATESVPAGVVDLLERFAQLTSAALANAQAQAQLRAEARLEGALRQVAAASASGTLGERALGQLVCDRVADLLGVAASAVWRFDEDWMTVLGCHGFADLPDRVAVGEPSVADRVRSAGAPVRIEDCAALDSGFGSRVAQRDGVRCAVGVPIVVEGLPWGALTVGSTETKPGLDMESVLNRFAELVAAALANAQARDRLRFRARLEAALREVASASASGEVDERALAGIVADRVADLLDAPVASVVRFAGGRMTRLGTAGTAGLPLDAHVDERSATGRVAQSAQTVVVEDYHGFAPHYEQLARATGAGSVVAVPLFAGGGLWGCVTVMLPRDAVPAGAVELLERVAQLISAALANAQAQARLGEDARLERAMRTVASAGAQGDLDEAGVADLAAAQIAELLDSPLAAVMRFNPAARSTVLGHAGPFPFPTALATDDYATVTAIVADTGRTARIDDYGALDGPFAALAVEHGIAGAIAVPVGVEGALWGCLGAMTDRQGGFAPGTETLLERLAAVVSVALANVRSLRALRHEARLEQALREISTATAGGELDAHDLFGLVAARVAELLDAPAAMVVRVEDASGIPVGVHGLDRLPDTLPVSESAAASVAMRTGRAARVDDYASLTDATRAPTTAAAAGQRSAVAAPVLLHGRAWGYIAVAKPDAHSFPPNTETVLERFAALVAVALAQADTLASLQRQASTDGLTGLLNHRAFQQRLHEEFARAQRHHRPLSLVMFDLDGFKLVNDLHGHRAGDDVLQTVGRVLERERRANDIPARVGGDEFALIAPDTTGAAALIVAERLRTSIAAALGDLELPVTLSAGVTDLTAATTTTDLLDLADSALYHAKHHGRDQAVHYTPGIDQTGDERRRALGGLTVLARAVDAKDSPTQRHSERVASISTQLALRLGWTPERCTRLREAALLHDVGKIGVPDSILTKPAALTDDEYDRVKAHVALGAQIAEGILDPEQVTWVRGHHERPDGRGYPDALTADTIPDGARLLAIADAYDTMTSGRPYKPAISPTDATREMRRHAGRQFDAELLDQLDQWALATTTTTGLTQTTPEPVPQSPPRN
jgi:diguanylate cyclase (GGDEF)-like protein